MKATESAFDSPRIADAALVDEIAKVIFNPNLVEWGERGDQIWLSCKKHRDDIPHTFRIARAVLKRLGYEVIESA